MQDFISRFMTGKKKISSAALLPVIVSAIQMTTGNSQQAETLIELVQEYMPTLVALVGGLGYAVIEGVNDNTKIKTDNSTAGTSTADAQTIVGMPKDEQITIAEKSGQEEEDKVIYLTAFNPAEWGQEKDAYLSWENFEDLFVRLDLRKFNPAIRYEFARQIVDEGFVRLKAAWQAAFEAAGAKTTIPVPAEIDFEGYDIKEPLKSELEAFLPNECARLSTKVINITSLYIAFVKMYERDTALSMLKGKIINWAKVSTIDDIKRLGLGAV